MIPKLAKLLKIISCNYDAFYYFKHAKRNCTTVQDLMFKAKIYK